MLPHHQANKHLVTSDSTLLLREVQKHGERPHGSTVQRENLHPRVEQTLGGKYPANQPQLWTPEEFSNCVLLKVTIATTSPTLVQLLSRQIQSPQLSAKNWKDMPTSGCKQLLNSIPDTLYKMSGFHQKNYTLYEEIRTTKTVKRQSNQQNQTQRWHRC